MSHKVFSVVSKVDKMNLIRDSVDHEMFVTDKIKKKTRAS